MLCVDGSATPCIGKWIEKMYILSGFIFCIYKICLPPGTSVVCWCDIALRAAWAAIDVGRLDRRACMLPSEARSETSDFHVPNRFMSGAKA
jgi:hypothetical protein